MSARTGRACTRLKPCDNSTMDRTLQHTLARLADNGDELLAVLGDAELNNALEAFREDRPRRLCCPKPHCHGKLAWIAISPYEPRVIGGRSGPMSDELMATQRRKHDLPESSWSRELPPLLRHWSLGPRHGADVGVPFDTDVSPNDCLHWLFTCGRAACRARYLATNSELLALLVAAHVKGPGDVVLPAGCELPAS